MLIPSTGAWRGCAFFCAILAVVSCDARQRDDLRDLDAEVSKSLTGDVTMQGRIVYPDGHPVPDAIIEVQWSTQVLPVSENQFQNETIRAEVDGTFVVRKKAVSGVNLGFHAESAYPTDWGFSFSSMRGAVRDDRAVTLRETITMDRRPRHDVALVRLSTFLSSDKDGPIRVLSIGRDLLRIANARRGSRVDDDHENPVVKLVVGEIGCGAHLWDGAEVRSEADAGAGGCFRLEPCEGGEGFLVHQVARQGTRPAVVFRGMNQAPSESYQCELPLTPPEGTGLIAFYVHAGGRYGKGTVSGSRVVVQEDGAEVSEAGFILFYDPAGGRDLTYDHP